MAEKIAVENGRISNFKGLVTLTLDRVILHAVLHHLLTSTYTHAKLHWNRKNVCGRTYVRMHVHTAKQTFETGFIRSILSNSRHNNDQLSKTSQWGQWREALSTGLITVWHLTAQNDIHSISSNQSNLFELSYEPCDIFQCYRILNCQFMALALNPSSIHKNSSIRSKACKQRHNQ